MKYSSLWSAMSNFKKQAAETKKKKKKKRKAHLCLDRSQVCWSKRASHGSAADSAANSSKVKKNWRLDIFIGSRNQKERGKRRSK